MPAPSLEDVTEALGTDHSWTDAEIARAYDSERANQAKRVRYPDPTDTDPDPDWPADLVEALQLRIEQHLAAARLPLGFQTTLTNSGSATVTVQDSTAKIRGLEAGHRRWAVG